MPVYCSAVYDPTSRTNEEDSIVLFELFVAEADVDGNLTLGLDNGALVCIFAHAFVVLMHSTR